LPIQERGGAVDGNSVTREPASKPPGPEGGFVLIEILVSALILTIASAGVIAVITTTIHSQGEQRHGSEAYALAQEDQARLASMQLGLLNHLNQTREVDLNQTVFKVNSSGLFVNDKTSLPSCTVGSSSADYVQITSKVTWPGMDNSEKAEIESILSPSNGSLDPNRGTLAIFAANESQTPMPGISVAGGSGAFSGVTDAAGCAVFPDLPSGNYQLAVNAEAAHLVNKDGYGVEEKTVGVVGGEAKRVDLRFDRPGTIPVNFKYRIGSTATYATSTADSVVAANTGMTETAKAIWNPSGLREATVNATPLFPFTSPYTLYAGSCAANNPNPEGKTSPPGAAAIANMVAPAGGITAPVTIQLPAFDPTVWSGKNEANKGSAFTNADVWIRDATCTKGSEPVTRRYTTDSSGKLTDLGLPWGVYNVCVDTTTGTGASRRQRISNVTVQNLLASTTREFFLGSGTGTVSETGACP
jgi:Tfp pilus assembly protein PilV